jgi:DNA-directed RNA polymerase omega subunit
MPSRPVEIPPPTAPVAQEELQNKFLLVVLAVQRARQLHNGARARVAAEGHKSLWVAAREVSTGRISWAVADKPPVLPFPVKAA